MIQLNDFLDRKNYKEIGKIGHKLKGDGSGYGFEALSKLGSDTEEAVKTSQSEILKSAIKNYQELLSEIKLCCSNIC